MRLVFVFSFFLLFLSTSLFAACNGSATIKVPAVVGDGSGLVTMEVRLLPGKSDVFLSTFPETGTSTQKSLDDAAHLAFRKFKEEKCDAIVSIDTAGSAGYVDGPSAGAAFTVLTYGALAGLEPRKDAVLTGTIDANGEVGQVGGIYEKAMATIAAGAKYFVMPRRSFLDILLLRNLETSNGLHVVEVTNADDAINFMLYNKSIPSQPFAREPEPVPSLQPYDTSGIEPFGDVSSMMISTEEKAINGMQAADNESVAIRDYFKSSLNRQRAIMNKGYYFSAANDAFLNYIQVSTISAVLNQNPDLEKKRSEVLNCLDSVPHAQKTDENFEWVVGSDLRESWARTRLNATDISGPKLQEEKFLAFNELMYPDAWCLVSIELAGQAKASGKMINESSWRFFAEKMVNEAEQVDASDPDLEERLTSAKSSLVSGRYGAAIIDSVYVVEMYNASKDIAAMPPDEIKRQIQAMLTEKRTSLWGRIYQAHGAFLSSENITETASAFRILRFSRALDGAIADMRKQSTPTAASPTASSDANPSYSQAVLLVSTFLIITLLLIYIASRARPQGRSYGTDTQGKRYRGIPRAGKEQG